MVYGSYCVQLQNIGVNPGAPGEVTLSAFFAMLEPAGSTPAIQVLPMVTESDKSNSFIYY
jgi:hypothetical protein